MVVMPPILAESWRDDPKHLGFVLARYKFVAKMLAGLGSIAEIGAGEGFASRVVSREIDCRFNLFDKVGVGDVIEHDITHAPLSGRYRAIYAIGVLEHIALEHRPVALTNICRSLTADGVFIAGCPSLESQKYASARSKEGHVSCMSGERFRAELREHFANVFMFGMNDEVVHTGFLPMAHYLFALCVGPK